MASAVNYEDCFIEEQGFFKISEDSYYLFINEKVYLVQIQDLTTPKNGNK